MTPLGPGSVMVKSSYVLSEKPIAQGAALMRRVILAHSASRPDNLYDAPSLTIVHGVRIELKKLC